MTAHKVAPIITATTKKLSPNGLGGGGPGRERASISAPHSSDVLKQFGNAQFSTFKAALTDLAVSKVGPIGAEMKLLPDGALRVPQSVSAVVPPLNLRANSPLYRDSLTRITAPASLQ